MAVEGMKSLRYANVKNKIVLLRTDFNVPLKNGKITDKKRIKESLPTIKYLLKKRAKIIIVSHLGRPDGKIVSELMLDPIAKELQKLIGKKVAKLNFKDDIKNELGKKSIVLLENIRFYPEEEKNNLDFAKKLSELADIYVNDAFGASHRVHASIVGIKKFLPSYYGFLVEKEIKMLSQLLKNPKRPFVVILGGAKVSDKIKTIENLAKIADTVLIGGAMAFTFLKAKGFEVGKSLFERDKIAVAKKLVNKYGEKIVLPEDIIIASAPDQYEGVDIVCSEEIPKGMMGLDIGKQTINFYKFVLKDAKTIFWNGPLGMAEIKPFDKGTKEIAEFTSKLKAVKIIGGGDTASIINKLKLSNKFTYISTGGGASLEFLEGRGLIGLK